MSHIGIWKFLGKFFLPGQLKGTGFCFVLVLEGFIRPMEPLWNMKEGPRSAWIVGNGSNEETRRQGTQLSVSYSFSYKVRLGIRCLHCREGRGASLLTSDPRSSEVSDDDREKARQPLPHEEEKGCILVARMEPIRSPDISLLPPTT